jgi:uncharacterized protein (UPF0332 family)
MNEKTWEDCLSEGDVRNVSKDIKKSESLIRTAEGRVKFFEIQIINEDTADYIFEGYYTSIIEFLHSIIISKGYNISNHICIGCYLRDVIKRNDLYRIFDDIRYKRNSLVYYGNRMDFETAKQAIEKCKKLYKELKGIVNNDI